MKRIKAGALGALVLVVLSLIFDFITYPLFASYGFKLLNIQNPLYFFVTTTIISFGIGLAFALLYIMLRAYFPYDGIEKGIVYGIFLWAMVEGVKDADIIAFTKLPIIYPVIWMLVGLIKYVAYGAVIYLLLEPHAHLWPHPEVLKYAVARPAGKVVVKRTAPKKKSRKR